jgi:glycosyltransferase involved in cell wall biosynthesis
MEPKDVLTSSPKTKKRICLVSEEIAGFAGSGGIGAAFEELAVSLAGHGHIVDILHTPVSPSSEDEARRLYERFMRDNIQLISMDFEQFVWGGSAHEKRAYSVYETLRRMTPHYDAIHFHDYKGLAFFCLSAKRQGLDFQNTTIVIQAHGPTRWALEANNALFTHQDQIKIDFMERKSIEMADLLVSPSQYLVDWMASHGYDLPASDRIHVIKNVCTLATRFSRGLASEAADAPVPANEIVLFARHEGRKGFVEFCKAIDSIADLLAERQVTVTFLGKLGEINGRPSGVELTNRAKNWKFPIKIRTKWDRYASLNYLASNPRSVVVIPSKEENSPYTVLEAVVLRKPVITSVDGGARELIDASLHDALLCPITPKELADKLTEAVTAGVPGARLDETPESIERRWADLHENLPAAAPVIKVKDRAEKPKVVFGITHYERPDKLLEAVLSAARQTYENMEIVVVDDGSTKPETLAKLENIEVLLKRLGGRLIRRENGYLGAARNTIAKNTTSDYLVFLDDDDLAFDTMVETLVEAAEASGADITNCFNLFMDESRRQSDKPAIMPEKFEQKVSYVPIGGPLSIASYENTLGAATALIRRSHFEKIGGYTEIHGVGFEDYEFYIRSLQGGAKLQIVPKALYLYEVGRPSMISNTSVFQNYRRILDAIELSQQEWEWRDFMALFTGRSALESNQNRVEWEYKSHPLSAHLVPLREGSNGTPDYAEKLAQYAEAVDAPAIAQAWRSSTQLPEREPTGGSRKAQSDKDTVTLFATAREEAPLPAVTSGLTYEDAAILLDLTMGRVQDAAVRVSDLIERRLVIDLTLSELVREIIRKGGDDLSEDASKSLLNRLIASQIQPENQISVAASALLLAKGVSEKKIIERILGNLFANDEAEYFEAYPDALQAVQDKKFVNSLHHFKEAGLDENRRGYPRLFALCKELEKAKGWSVVPWTLGDVLGVPGVIARGPALTRRFKIAAGA